MKYKSISKVVDVIVYKPCTNCKEVYEFVNRGVEDAEPFEEMHPRGCHSRVPFYVPSPEGGSDYAWYGDYIVRQPSGYLEVFTREQFFQHYESINA